MINRYLKKSHPNFYEVLNLIKKIQANSWIEIVRLKNGLNPSNRRKKNILNQIMELDL